MHIAMGIITFGDAAVFWDQTLILWFGGDFGWMMDVNPFHERSFKGEML